MQNGSGEVGGGPDRCKMIWALPRVDLSRTWQQIIGKTMKDMICQDFDWYFQLVGSDVYLVLVTGFIVGRGMLCVTVLV